MSKSKNRGPKAFASPGEKPADAPAAAAGAPTDQVEKQRKADAERNGATEAKDQVEKQREADAQKGDTGGQATQAGQAGADDTAASGQRDPDGGAAAADAGGANTSTGAGEAVKPEPNIAAEVDAAIDAADTPPLSIEIRAARGAREAVLYTLFALNLNDDDEFDQAFAAIGEHNYDVTEEASRFLLANRDAPSAAIPIHLAMRGLGQKRQLSDVEAMLWDVFRTVLLQIFDLLTARAAWAAAEKPAPVAGGMGGDQAFLPQPGPFEPAGFTPRR